MADAPPSPADDVRRILAARTSSTLEDARKAGGDAPAGEVEAIERLARLLALHEAAVAVPPRRSWHLAAVLAATLALVSLLLFARVGRTEIDLEVEATQAHFTIGAGQKVLDATGLATLGVSGLARLRVPAEAAAALRCGEVIEEADLAIRLAVKEVNGRRGAIGLGEIRPVGDTIVDVQVDGPGRSRLWLQDSLVARDEPRQPELTIDVGVAGPIDLTIDGIGSALVDFDLQGLVLEPTRERGLALALGFLETEPAALAPQMPISALAFWRVDEPGDRRLDTARSLSTIVGGALYFDELDGMKRPLRAGEILRFARVDGEVRTLALGADRLSLGFHGRVEGMSTAAAPNVRSLMPTWLEWLKAQHGLSLLWGSTLYLAGLAVAALRWFKGPL